MKQAALCVLLLVAGCKSYPYERMHTPVNEAVYTFPAAIPTGSPALTTAETQGVDAMLAEIPPASVRLASIAPGRYDEPGKLEALQYHLMERGFAAEAIQILGSAQQPVMTLRVQYRVFPQLTDCGKWYSEGTFNEINSMDSQMGCSSAHNLRAMVAQPLDLIAPQTATGAETDTAVRAIGIYNGTVKPEVSMQEMLKAAYTSRTTDEN